MVELTVEINETETLEISVKTLHFLGFTDHAKMTNRDAKDQHPIEAITGLAEKLKTQDETISQHGEVLSTYSGALSQYRDVINAHGETLSQHGQTIVAQGETLTAHAEALAKLAAFSDKKIASVSDVQEVLTNA